jgi:hypothetical protein
MCRPEPGDTVAEKRLLIRGSHSFSRKRARPTIQSLRRRRDGEIRVRQVSEQPEPRHRDARVVARAIRAPHDVLLRCRSIWRKHRHSFDRKSGASHRAAPQWGVSRSVAAHRSPHAGRGRSSHVHVGRFAAKNTQNARQLVPHSEQATPSDELLEALSDLVTVVAHLDDHWLRQCSRTQLDGVRASTAHASQAGQRGATITEPA